MRQRRQIAGGSHRALRGDEREDVRGEHREKRLDRRDADSGVPARERVGSQRHHRAHGGAAERLADARGVAPDEVALERLDLPGRDRDVGELSEARRDAIDLRP